MAVLVVTCLLLIGTIAAVTHGLVGARPFHIEGKVTDFNLGCGIHRDYCTVTVQGKKIIVGCDDMGMHLRVNTINCPHTPPRVMTGDYVEGRIARVSDGFYTMTCRDCFLSKVR